MSTTRSTPTFYVFHFRAYGEAQLPADVYVRKDQFRNQAIRYGHSDVNPDALADFGQTVGERLFDSLRPDRVRYT
jgi:hypothetical protein